MDWQVIILTLGASFITGFVTIIGNIIISRINLRKTIIENQHNDKKEFIDKRFNAYDQILKCLSNLSENKIIKNNDYSDQKEQIDKIWKTNYHYCSKRVNNYMSILIKNFDFSLRSKQRIKFLSEEMKKDIDKFYGIRDKSVRNKY